VGKATLAWRLARFLLATPEDDGGMFAAPPPTSLVIPEGDPVAVRMRALSEPRLFLLRRGANQTGSALSQVITAPDVVERFEKAGGRPMAVMGDDAKALQRRDIERWVPLIKAAGIQPE
jgi:hypothetical protein